MSEGAANMPTKILVVDDDQGLRDLLKKYLDQNGFHTSTVEDGISLDQWLESDSPDLIILDLMLPGEDGLSIARRLQVSHQIPVIMLTARGEELDRIIGLEVGADDYLSKPFNPRELLARIRAVLRRTSPIVATQNSEESFNFSDFSFNLNSKVLTRNGAEITLTSGDLDLLEILLLHPNHVLSRNQIMDQLNIGTHDSFDRSVDVRITRLRAKIEDNPSSPSFIRTVRGQGYRFTPEGVSHEASP